MVACLMFAAGCDSAGGLASEEVVVGDSLTYLRGHTLTNGRIDIRFGEMVSSIYASESRGLLPGGGGSLSGIWMATDSPVHRANLETYIPNGINRFKGASPDTATAGVLVVTADSLQTALANWPTHLGAPSISPGVPRLYGDRMVWTAKLPAEDQYPASASIRNVRLGVSAFLFDTGPLEDVAFLRYDITNTGDETLQNVHVGFGSDLDLYHAFSGSTVACRSDSADPNTGYNSLWVDHNSSGYDLDRHLSYVYSRPIEGLDLPDACYGLVAGFSILDLSGPGGLAQPKLAHRIWRERTYVEYGAFGETLMGTPEAILLGLQGLAPDGSAMYDSTRQETTRFAFTGDPMEGTGWLDVRHDFRAVQSIEPFDILPGETRSMMVAFIVYGGDDLESGLAGLKATYDQVVGNRDLWDS